MRPGTFLFLSLIVCLDGCGAGIESSGAKGGSPVLASPPPTLYRLDLRVTDEAGAPLPGAAVELAGVERLAGGDGRLSLEGLDEPAVLVASAPGFLDEPLAL